MCIADTYLTAEYGSTWDWEIGTTCIFFVLPADSMNAVKQCV